MILFLNGPPRSGKDLLAKYISAVHNADHMHMAKPLKETTHALYGLNLPFDFFEESKDKPRAAFFGKSPRQAYIEVSEKLVKPALGKEHFGKVAVEGIKHKRSLSTHDIVFSDSGFVDEMWPIFQAFPNERMALIRIHRPNCDFSNDSRSYLNPVTIPSFDIWNNGTAPKFFEAFEDLLPKLLA